MIRRVLFALGFVAAGAIVAGCGSSYPKCDDDEVCREYGQVCVNGTCQECGQDGDCKAGFKCQNNACVPAAECQSNFDCTGGRVCQNGKCTACESDGACGPNATCQNGACVPKPECVGDADCGNGRVCIDGSCQAAPAPDCRQGPVRFPFNQANLEAEARNALQTLADCLKSKYPNSNVTIEGHADERGTEEYNITLGEKRANAVKKYLVNLGVKNNRLKTVSYGEERPVNRGSDEGAWAENRRAEFVITP